MQHRAALAAQGARARGDIVTEKAAKAMISTLGELNQLHGRLVDAFVPLAPHVGLGAIPVPVAMATAFSSIALAVLWFFRKVDLQEELLAQLEAGNLTESGYIAAQESIGAAPDPITGTLQAGAGIAKWAAIAFLGWALLQGLGLARAFAPNPPLMVFKSNPPGRMSDRVWMIGYKHIEDGEDYVHEFGPDVSMEAEKGGSVSIFHRNGRPVWREF